MFNLGFIDVSVSHFARLYITICIIACRCIDVIIVGSRIIVIVKGLLTAVNVVICVYIGAGTCVSIDIRICVCTRTHIIVVECLLSTVDVAHSLITTVDIVVGVDVGAGRCVDIVVVICVGAGAVYRGSRCGGVIVVVGVGVGAGDRGRAGRCVIGIYQSLGIVLCGGRHGHQCRCYTSDHFYGRHFVCS